jgi:uncharacterized protein YjbI with pentapeptide repeats
MNPLLLVRGIAGLGMPVALVVATRRRHGRSAGHGQETRPEGPPRPRLAGAALAGYVKQRHDLHAIDLRQAKLDRLDLSGRSLDRVDLSGASLVGADLSGASLNDVLLRSSDLSGANLSGADLSGADLVEATLWKADLRGARMSSCHHLVMATVRLARYDDTTRWPPGFDPVGAGAVRG